MQSIENKVKNRIYGNGRGLVFTPNLFLDLGSRGAIDVAIGRLVKKRIILRLVRGLYYYPKKHPVIGQLPPSPEAVAQTLAKKDNLRIQPSGAYAANLLGLTEQVPAKIVFLTDGSQRSIKIGKQCIIFKKTTPRNMATAGKISGLVIQALRYIGKENVSHDCIRKLLHKLKKQEKVRLLKDIRFAPVWIGEIFRKLSMEQK